MTRAWRRAGIAAIAVVLSLISVPHAEAARSKKAAEPESVRVVRRISISDRGIEIDHEGQEDKSQGDASQAEPESESARPRARGRVSVEGRGLKFEGYGGHVRVPGVEVDVDEGEGIVRVFSDAEVRAGERVDGDVVAVFGSVLVEGQVSGNVVAVFGSVRLKPGASVQGDAVAVGGLLDQPSGATVGGESVSLAFLPFQWGGVSLGAILGAVLLAWILSLFAGWVLSLLFPTRMLRIAVTASRRTGASFVLGIFSAPLVVITICLLLITVIGIPIAFVLPLVYLVAIWAGQLAAVYVLGCRLLRRRLGEGNPSMTPMLAGTLFVAAFFVIGAFLAGPAGAIRTVALFFNLLGALLVLGLSVIGTGAVLLSRAGSRPRDVDFERAPHTMAAGPAPQAASPPAAGTSGG